MQLLEAPKAILNASSWVIGALDPNHEQGHEGEEEGDDEAKPIDCLISNHHSTVHLGFESYDFCSVLTVVSYGGHFEHLYGFSLERVKPRQAMSVHYISMRGAERDLDKNNISKRVNASSGVYSS